MRLDGTACAGTVSVLFVFALLFASFPTGSAENLQTDYVRYVIFENTSTVIENTIIEGDIVDNELGTPVGGAGVGGEVPSEIIYVNVQADENGHFRVVLPKNLTDENHTFIFNISAPGYDNRRVENVIKRGETKYLRIPLNYNPFDVQLAENSGSLTRGWVENRYTLVVVDNYKATRQVVTGYKGEPAYGQVSCQIQYPKLYTSQVPSTASYNSSFWEGFQKNHYDSIYGSVNNPFRREVQPNSFQDFTRGSSTWYMVNSGGTYNGKPHYIWDSYIGGRSYLETAKGFRQFQYFHPGSWSMMPVYDDGFGKSGLFIAYYVTAPTCYYCIDSTFADSKVTPLYGAEDYTVWRTTAYDVRDSALDNWASKQTTVTATPRNGYTGGVKLALEFDSGITAELGKSELQFASPASTTLTLKPKPETHGSPHSATLRAYDSNGRLVIGGARKPALACGLSLTTLPKPATENTAVNVTESETKPAEVGQTYDIPSSRKEIGAMGGLYDRGTGKNIFDACGGTSTGANVVSTISSNKQSSFTWSGTNSQYSYNHSSLTCHADEVWVMNPMRASANKYFPDTRSTTVSAGGTNTVNFSLWHKP